MDRKTLASFLVLDQMAEDYESVESILLAMNRGERMRGLGITADEIKECLSDLVRREWAGAYWYSEELLEFQTWPWPPAGEDMDDSSNCYFFIAEKGRAELSECPELYDLEGDVVEHWREF